jgi:uncharacterized low-complexity protein
MSAVSSGLYNSHSHSIPTLHTLTRKQSLLHILQRNSSQTVVVIVRGDSSCGDSSCGDIACGDSACGDSSCGDSACGDSACGDSACGDSSCGDSSVW